MGGAGDIVYQDTSGTITSTDRLVRPIYRRGYPGDHHFLRRACRRCGGGGGLELCFGILECRVPCVPAAGGGRRLDESECGADRGGARHESGSQGLFVLRLVRAGRLRVSPGKASALPVSARITRALAGPVSVEGSGGVSAVGLDAANVSVDLAVNAVRAEELSAKFVAADAGFENAPPATMTATGATGASRSAAIARLANGSVAMPAAVRSFNNSTEPMQTPMTDANASVATRAANASAAPTAAASIAARWFTASPVSTSASYTGVRVDYKTPGVMLIPQSMLPAGYTIKHVSIQREGRALVPLALTAGGSLFSARDTRTITRTPTRCSCAKSVRRRRRDR